MKQAARGRSTAADTTNSVTRTAISLEYASLRHTQHCPLGMYVVPSAESLLVWDAVFFIHQGYYAGAILRFRIAFPSNYPEGPPVVHFMTDVFHPLISSENGTFNMSPRFRPWRPKEHRVFDVLHYIKATFKKHALDRINEPDCLNKEAFRYHNSTSSFAALATQSATLSKSASALFDGDHPSVAEKVSDGITFRESTEDQLQRWRSDLGLREWDEHEP